MKRWAGTPPDGRGRTGPGILRPVLRGTPIGLCTSCAHQKVVRTGRGSEFSMCLRHRDDERYPKYPRLPVTACPGHEPRT